MATKRALLERIKALRILIQSNGAALLLDGHPALVARAEADGAHLTGTDALKAAIARSEAELHCRLRRARVAPRRDAGWRIGRRLRHVRRAGATAAGRRFDAVLERVAWWAEIFPGPCVGYAASARRGRGARARGRRFRRDRRRRSGATAQPCARRSSAARRGARAMNRAACSSCGVAARRAGRAGQRARSSRCRSRRRWRGRRRASRRKPAHEAEQNRRAKARRQRSQSSPSRRRSSVEPNAAARPAAAAPLGADRVRAGKPLVQQPFTPPENARRNTSPASDRAAAADAAGPAGRRCLRRLSSAATISRPSGRRRAAPANRAIRSP